MRHVMTWDECAHACQEWMEKKLDFIAMEPGRFVVETAGGEVGIENIEFYCDDEQPEGEG